jgi:hypothetical protein
VGSTWSCRRPSVHVCLVPAAPDGGGRVAPGGSGRAIAPARHARRLRRAGHPEPPGARPRASDRLWAVPGPVVGHVRTVLAGPSEADGPAQHIAAAAIEAAGEGRAGHRRLRSGGRLLVGLHPHRAPSRRGIGEVTIDRACDDIPGSEEHGIPVFGQHGRGRAQRSARHRGHARQPVPNGRGGHPVTASGDRALLAHSREGW